MIPKRSLVAAIVHARKRHTCFLAFLEKSENGCSHIFVAYAQIVDNMNDDIVEPPTWYAAACQPNTAAPTTAHFADCLTDFAWCCAQAASEKGAAPRCPPEKLTSISAALGIDTIVERKNH